MQGIVHSITDCPLSYYSPAHSKPSRPDRCTGRTAGTGPSWSTPKSGETSHRCTACCTTRSTPCGRRGIGLRVRYAIECGPRCDAELTVVHLQEAVLAPGPLLLRDVEAVVDGDGVTVGHVLARVETQIRARVDLDLAAAALGEVPQLLINECASVGEAAGAGASATAHAQERVHVHSDVGASSVESVLDRHAEVISAGDTDTASPGRGVCRNVTVLRDVRDGVVGRS